MPYTPPVGIAASSSDPLQKGVVGSGSGVVSVGSSTQLNVAAGAAWVQNAAGVLVRVNWSAATLAVPAATLDRLDQVVVDTAGNITRQPGTTDSATNTLGNRGGADDAGINAGKLRLADVLVTSTGVAAGNIRDRRPWALGAFTQISRTQNASGGSDYNTTSTTLLEIDTTNLSARIECTGNPIRLTLACMSHETTGGFSTRTWLAMDGGAIDGYPTSPATSAGNPSQSNWDYHTQLSRVIVPPAGSHRFAPMFAADSGGGTTVLKASATNPLDFTVEEIMRPNANNGSA